MEDRIVLKRVWLTNIKSLSTYYVYDDFGNLRYVLPPAVNENTDRITAALSSFTEGDAEFNDFIYGYHYDGRNRLVEKKVPGKGWEELVYNPLDRVVFTQDAVQKQNSERSYMKYDGLGRVIMTGIESSQTATRVNLQNTVNALTVFWDVRNNAAGNFHGYSNASAPSNLDNVKPQVINYYDDYNIPGLPYNYASSYSNRTKGLLTATKVKVLGSTSDFLWTVNYYDDEGRVVKTYRQHYLSGGVNAANYDEISNTYNFTGEVTASNRVHRTTGGSTTISNRYEYDHMGRELATMQEINGQGETVLSKLDYNEIGQLKTKNQGGAAGIPFLQSTNFGYNERGWMTTSTNSLFSMQLSYQENSSEQYNGNISKQSWGAGTNTSSAGVYSYGYDKLNRLLSAVSTGVVMSETITYDVMGNIHTLKRDAGGANLYHYNGNRLHYAEYFTDGYAYDANGNAIVDGRTHYNFQYNQLNLPSVVSNGINLSFVYDATGRKLRQTSTAGTVNYIDGIQYKPNGTIDFIQTGEGVARSNAGGSYSYEYNLADHLGNNRVTYYKNPSNNQVEILQRDNYYAFGLRKVALAGNNKYLYNGKELQSELGLYDYGARFYDPVIGRWTTVDPLAEKGSRWSPYVYAFNDPIRYIDPDGMWPDWLDKAITAVSNSAKGAYAGLTQRFQTEPARGATVTGIRDTHAGKVRNGTPVGDALVRVDNAHPGANTPHINVNPKLSGVADPHTAISPSTLKGLENTGKALDAFKNVAIPVAITTDVIRLGTAFNQDGNKIGNNTLITTGSVAGGWGGAWAGAGIGSAGGFKIGGIIGTFIEPGGGTALGAGVGGLLGGLGGGIAGAFGGSWLGETTVKKVIEK